MSFDLQEFKLSVVRIHAFDWSLVLLGSLQAEVKK